MVRYSERLDKIMKNNLKNELKDNYTIIPNVLIRDNSVSDRARFIFCLLASKPDDWIFYNRALARELNYSVDTLRKYINELIRKGWIEKYEYPFKANDYILKATNSILLRYTPTTVFQGVQRSFGVGNWPDRRNLRVCFRWSGQ